MKKALVFLLLISSSYAFPEINTFENWLEEEISNFNTEDNTLQKENNMLLKKIRSTLKIRD